MCQCRRAVTPLKVYFANWAQLALPHLGQSHMLLGGHVLLLAVVMQAFGSTGGHVGVLSTSTVDMPEPGSLYFWLGICRWSKGRRRVQGH